MSRSHPQLLIENFGPLGRVDIQFRDITVLVGPQASGKSLVLQWLKLAIDRGRILGTLSKHGYSTDHEKRRLLGLMFGAGYQDAVGKSTKVVLDGENLDLDVLARTRMRHEEHKVLYIPAHRTLVMGTGWPLLFRGVPGEPPFVVREFSECTQQFLESSKAAAVFPITGRLRGKIRQVLDEAIFHGGRVETKPSGVGEKKLQMVFGDKGRETSLSLMEWTTGQREALPLILGLYDALPAGAVKKRKSLDRVIIEEPELGLHPDGILAIMLLLLELVQRGYRLVLSTHSPLVLDVFWAMQHLREEKDGPAKLLDVFRSGKSRDMREWASTVLKKDVSIYFLDYRDGRSDSHDITSLDPMAASEEVAGWGRLIQHSTRIADIISG